MMPNHFVGRDAQVAQLVQQLTSGQTLALSADGKPGVGKTTLAVALARHGAVLRHFSDGVLWGGLGTNADPMHILGEWATALGHDLSHLSTPQERQRALQNILGSKKILLVLDDAWQLEPATLLRCGGPHCAHLLTTRDKSIARAFAGTSQMNNVETLPLADGVALLEQLAPEACATNPEAAEKLVNDVGGLPLAIELLGRYLADPNAPERLYVPEKMVQAMNDMTIPALRLQLASQRLGSHDAPTSLQATIELSLADLPEPTQTAFYCLGAFAPKPATFSWEAALAVTEANNRQLATLIERNLLEVEGQRLALHQTLAEVAKTHAAGTSASQRHRDFYLQLANKNRHDWQTIELVYEQVQWAWKQLPEDDVVFEYLEALRIYQTLRGLNNEQITWITRALSIAKKKELSDYEAALLNNIGMVYRALGKLQLALESYNQALLINQKFDSHIGKESILNNIGEVYGMLGEPEQALEFLNQALSIRRQINDLSGEATTLNNIGYVYYSIGQPKQAFDFFNQSLPILIEIGNRKDEATALNNIGLVFNATSQFKKALSYFEQALPIHHEVGNRLMEATTLNNIGVIYHAFGNYQQALEFFEQALPMHREVGNRLMEAITLNNIGLAYDKIGQPQKALNFYNQALPINREVEDHSGEATTLNNIGLVYDKIGQPQKALNFYNQALLIRCKISDRLGEATILNNIGGVYNNLNQYWQALDFYDQALRMHQEVGNRAMEATILNNIGEVFRNIGLMEQALDYYIQALHIVHAINDHQGEMVTRYNMTRIFGEQKQFAKAKEEMVQVVKLAEYLQSLHLERFQNELALLEAELAARGD